MAFIRHHTINRISLIISPQLRFRFFFRHTKNLKIHFVLLHQLFQWGLIFIIPGKSGYKKRYRKRHNCIIYGICYGADDRTRTCTSKTEEPKSTESTNSTTSAFSVVPLNFTRRGNRGGAFCLIHFRSVLHTRNESYFIIGPGKSQPGSGRNLGRLRNESGYIGE